MSVADPADRVAVSTTVAPSLTWTVPAGVAPVAATVATRLAVRPETCPESVVVVVFAGGYAATVTDVAVDVEPTYRSRSAGTNVAV